MGVAGAPPHHVTASPPARFARAVGNTERTTISCASRARGTAHQPDLLVRGAPRRFAPAPTAPPGASRRPESTARALFGSVGVQVVPRKVSVYAPYWDRRS
ncbi:hypothetical protein MTO96_008597 [Rhipicephalus appendiculatus]